MFFSINWLTFQCCLGANLRGGSIRRYNLLRFFFFVQRSRQHEKHLPLELIIFFLEKKLTGSFKIVQSIFIAPFYGKLQEKEIVT